MSEISNQIHCNELRTMNEKELIEVLETVKTDILIKALHNKVNKLETLRDDMKMLFER